MIRVQFSSWEEARDYACVNATLQDPHRVKKINSVWHVERKSRPLGWLFRRKND